ncbi:Uncharacterised protein [Leclercia adecarboxylata]|uniref:Uncharacterized protein n=1 Tax=Leclercia adecarboxylata TaxID=83655 RepID=A0A4U9HV12_9ENTR|nr:Uncharacterised protein [Leclercia adecarboxylata]
MIKVYGVPGWGSAISEVMLTLADIPYQFINVDGFDKPGETRELLEKTQPLVPGADPGAGKRRDHDGNGSHCAAGVGSLSRSGTARRACGSPAVSAAC